MIALNYMRKIKMHIKAVNQCVLMIENIEILLSYNNLSVNEIFSNLAQNNSLTLLDFINKISLNLSSGVNDYILSEENRRIIISSNYLNNIDVENLISFFSILGKSDLNGQLMNCETYKEIFKNSVKKLEKNEYKDCKSIGTVIVGLGILLVILIY